MNVPNFVNGQFVDENGMLTPEWNNVLNQLLTQAQLNLGPEGYVVPQLTTVQIAQLTKPQSIGAMVYDSTALALKVNINGVWKTVTVT